jgi:hypothetical protein
LQVSSGLRPDLMVILPGRRILTDVAICHSLAPGRVKDGKSRTTLRTAKTLEADKRRKYRTMNAQHQMELLPFVVETCGGLGPAAVKLLKAMAAAGEEHLAMWPKQDIMRYVVGSVAIAVQRGSTMAYLEGYDRAVSALGKPSKEKRKKKEEEDEEEEEEEEEEEAEEAEEDKEVEEEDMEMEEKAEQEVVDEQ